MSRMRDHFKSLARYNRWANRRLYAACAELPAEEYHRPRAAFFKSLHGTLNHILAGDRIWLARFMATEHGITALDQELCSDLATLRAARETEDAEIIRFIDGLAAVDLGHILHYRNMAGEEQARPLDRLLLHFFNHQTHHRGQAHDQLTQTAVVPPPLDYLYFMAEAD